MKLSRSLSLGGVAALVPHAAQADINVGIGAARTGPGASLGIAVCHALSMGIQDIAGEKVVLRVLDDAGEPTAATKNARRFVVAPLFTKELT